MDKDFWKAIRNILNDHTFYDMQRKVRSITSGIETQTKEIIGIRKELEETNKKLDQNQTKEIVGIRKELEETNKKLDQLISHLKGEHEVQESANYAAKGHSALRGGHAQSTTVIYQAIA